MSKLFGTDGVRGIANEQLTPQLAFELGKGAAFVLGKEKKESPCIIVGKDTRISGDMLENALVAGMMSMGANVVKAGIIPTPAVAYLIQTYKADAGVVISASHNSFEYNGIKFFNEKGFKLSDKLEEEIEEIILNNEQLLQAKGENIGRCTEEENKSKEMYVEHLISTVDISLEGLKIVLDCANGASYEVAAQVYKRLGAEVETINDEPNGININDKCGSTHPEGLQKAVLEKGAHIGLAFDGDADRLIAVDEKGRIIDGDKVICICAQVLKTEGRLKRNLVTGTVMSNLGFHKHLEKIGCKTQSTKVGDRYVLEKMIETGGVIGGEQSGHIIFLDYATTGDGALASLQLVKAMKLTEKTPSQLSDEIKLYPQVLENAKVKDENKNKYTQDDEIVNAIKSLEEKMAGDGRVLIRPSGTEPLVRVMIEGSDIEKIEIYAKELAQLITDKLA